MSAPSSLNGVSGGVAAGGYLRHVVSGALQWVVVGSEGLRVYEAPTPAAEPLKSIPLSELPYYTKDKKTKEPVFYLYSSAVCDLAYQSVDPSVRPPVAGAVPVDFQQAPKADVEFDRWTKALTKLGLGSITDTVNQSVLDTAGKRVEYQKKVSKFGGGKLPPPVLGGDEEPVAAPAAKVPAQAAVTAKNPAPAAASKPAAAIAAAAAVAPAKVVPLESNAASSSAGSSINGGAAGVLYGGYLKHVVTGVSYWVVVNSDGIQFFEAHSPVTSPTRTVPRIELDYFYRDKKHEEPIGYVYSAPHRDLVFQSVNPAVRPSVVEGASPALTALPKADTEFDRFTKAIATMGLSNVTNTVTPALLTTTKGRVDYQAQLAKSNSRLPRPIISPEEQVELDAIEKAKQDELNAQQEAKERAAAEEAARLVRMEEERQAASAARVAAADAKHAAEELARLEREDPDAVPDPTDPDGTKPRANGFVFARQQWDATFIAVNGQVYWSAWGPNVVDLYDNQFYYGKRNRDKPARSILYNRFRIWALNKPTNQEPVLVLFGADGEQYVLTVPAAQSGIANAEERHKVLDKITNQLLEIFSGNLKGARLSFELAQVGQPAFENSVFSTCYFMAPWPPAVQRPASFVVDPRDKTNHWNGDHKGIDIFSRTTVRHNGTQFAAFFSNAGVELYVSAYYQGAYNHHVPNVRIDMRDITGVVSNEIDSAPEPALVLFVGEDRHVFAFPKEAHASATPQQQAATITRMIRRYHHSTPNFKIGHFDWDPRKYEMTPKQFDADVAKANIQ